MKCQSLCPCKVPDLSLSHFGESLSAAPHRHPRENLGPTRGGCDLLRWCCDHPGTCRNLVVGVDFLGTLGSGPSMYQVPSKKCGKESR